MENRLVVDVVSKPNTMKRTVLSEGDNLFKTPVCTLEFMHMHMHKRTVEVGRLHTP